MHLWWVIFILQVTAHPVDPTTPPVPIDVSKSPEIIENIPVSHPQEHFVGFGSHWKNILALIGSAFLFQFLAGLAAQYEIRQDLHRQHRRRRPEVSRPRPIKIRRDHLWQDSKAALSRILDSGSHSTYRIKFKGEMGIDDGGLNAEWKDLLINELFERKLFQPLENGEYYLTPSNHHEEEARDYSFAGSFLGLCFLTDTSLGVPFHPAFYQIISNATESITLSLFPSINERLNMLKTMTLDQSMGIYFAGGVNEPLSKEISPDTPVTEENKDEYIK
jgi:hypothetical protein